RQGGAADLEAVVRQLTDMAYARVDLVEKRGEFAVRGGILDVFPPTEEHPLRVEFWGDEVEEIRSFAVADQRTIAPVERLWAPPCRELLLTPEVRERAAALAEQHPALREMLDKLAAGIPVEGMESLAPALVPGDLELLLDDLPEHTVVLLCDPERIRTRAHDLVRTSEEFLDASWAAAAVGGKVAGRRVRCVLCGRRHREPGPGHARGYHRPAGVRVRRRGVPAGGRHRYRHLRRAWSVHKGHAEDAEPAAQHDRPAGA